MRVLVTGAAGSIGRVVTRGLTELGHTVVALDRVPKPDEHDGRWHVADCADPVAVSAVFASEPIDGVVHLAGHPDEASLADSLTSHTVTTAALLDAMVEHSVNRLVYASSNHAVGRTPRRELVTIDTRPRPDTFYGVAKVAAEALMSLYADRYGLDVISCRIGSFMARPETRTPPEHVAVPRRLCPHGRGLAHHTRSQLCRALRHLGEHPVVVGPGAGTSTWIRPAGRRRGVLPLDSDRRTGQGRGSTRRRAVRRTVLLPLRVRLLNVRQDGRVRNSTRATASATTLQVVAFSAPSIGANIAILVSGSVRPSV